MSAPVVPCDNTEKSNSPEKWTVLPPKPEGMSKSAWKRELKKQKHESQRDEWIEMRREKRRDLKRRRKLGLTKKPSSATTNAAISGSEIKRPVLKDQKLSGVKIILDCGFDSLMKEGEVTSLSQQITRCYAVNRRAVKPVDFHVHSLNGELLKRFQGPIKNMHLQWQDDLPKRVTFHDDDFEPDSKNMFYLSSDSDNVLDKLEVGKTYIVGGIVDKGRYKNLCKDKAEKHGIPTGRLPIEEYIQLSGRNVLTTNHVFEILLKFLELEDWKLAFEAVLPPRKLKDEKNKLSKGGKNVEKVENIQTDYVTEKEKS